MNEEEENVTCGDLAQYLSTDGTVKIPDHDIKVTSVEECNKADYWVCQRVADVPQIGLILTRAEIAQCTRCGLFETLIL